MNTPDVIEQPKAPTPVACSDWLEANMKWHKFDKSKGYRQLRPPIGKWVVVKLEAKPHDVATLPCGLAIGYRKDAAGDKTCPYFVIPGIGGEVLEWCDCLPEGFEYPKASNS